MAAAFDGGDVGGHRRGGLREGDAEFGEALIDAHGPAPSTARLRESTLAVDGEAGEALADRHQLDRVDVEMRRQVASHQKVSAMSSAVIGFMPA